MGPLPEYLVGMFQNTSLPQIRPQIGQTCGWPTTVIWALARFAAYLPHLPHLPCSTRLHPAPPRLPCFPTFPTCPKLQRGSREGGGESGCKWGKWGKRGKRGKRGKWQKTDPPEFWARLNDLVSLKHQQGVAGCVEALNGVNFSQAMAVGHDMLLDTPLAEHFLDFYAVAPFSKVVLTTRGAADWVKSRIQFDRTLAAPMHSPCGLTLDEINADVATRLYEAHERLVHCMVPAEKLMEINVFDSPVDVPALMSFLGWPEPQFAPLYPRIGEVEAGSSRYEEEENYLICITGQIRRLELKTKVENLFLPLAAAGYNVLVALVLDPRQEPKYINRPAGEWHEDYQVTDGNFTTLAQAAEMLPKSINLIADPFIPHDYPVDERYVEDLYQTMPWKGRDMARSRGQSHMRQWETLHRCSQLPWGPGKHMMRLRDDDVVMEPFVPPSMLEENTLYVPKCNPCYGVNDKFALAVGRGTAQAYLTLPLQTVRWDFDRLQKQLQGREPHRSPEQVLDTVLNMSGVAVKLLEKDELPILPAKNMRKDNVTYLCYFVGSDAWRDCISQARLERLQAEGFSIEHTHEPNPEFYCESTPQRFLLQP
ncbi:Crnkl1 [Symbiodinium natans]|uniref:Crnkl1 protein n=1 Tax=Symbiodinium natans TaxID=878477 RepID=A0A812SRI8_9DINO|nr:Crnkl1 [Symbiodinium natans]